MAFAAMVSPEIFEESLRVAVAEWRSAGFTSACLDVAEAAARAAYHGSSAGCRAGEARRKQLEPDTRTVVERLGIEDFPRRLGARTVGTPPDCYFGASRLTSFAALNAPRLIPDRSGGVER
jgi:hypothetical protein